MNPSFLVTYLVDEAGIVLRCGISDDVHFMCDSNDEWFPNRAIMFCDTLKSETYLQQLEPLRKQRTIELYSFDKDLVQNRGIEFTFQAAVAFVLDELGLRANGNDFLYWHGLVLSGGQNIGGCVKALQCLIEKLDEDQECPARRTVVAGLLKRAEDISSSGPRPSGTVTPVARTLFYTGEIRTTAFEFHGSLSVDYTAETTRHELREFLEDWLDTALGSFRAGDPGALFIGLRDLTLESIDVR